MNTYKRHRLPPHTPDILSHAVGRYYRFNLSDRHIEGELAARGIAVNCQAMVWRIEN
jgi:transposase-like protein